MVRWNLKKLVYILQKKKKKETRINAFEPGFPAAVLTDFLLSFSLGPVMLDKEMPLNQGVIISLYRCIGGWKSLQLPVTCLSCISHLYAHTEASFITTGISAWHCILTMYYSTLWWTVVWLHSSQRRRAHWYPAATRRAMKRNFAQPSSCPVKKIFCCLTEKLFC